MIQCSDLGKIYSTYSAAQSPATQLHAPNGYTRCRDEAQKYGAQAKASKAHDPSAYLRHNAQAYGYQAAAVGAGMLRALDVVFGTGVHHKGPFKLSSAADLCNHLGDVTAEFCDTGLAGLVTGTLTGMPMAIGAALGAAVACLGIAAVSLSRALSGKGFKVEGSQDTCNAGVATGALLGATAFGLIVPTYLLAGAWMATLGAARVYTGLIKATAVGALYGAGYAVGYAVALMQVPTARTTKTTAA